MRGLVQTGFFKERVQMTVKSVFGMLHLLSLSFISTVYWVFTLPNTFMPPSTQVQSEILPILDVHIPHICQRHRKAVS